jgi:hypothetical protein
VGINLNPWLISNDGFFGYGWIIGLMDIQRIRIKKNFFRFYLQNLIGNCPGRKGEHFVQVGNTWKAFFLEERQALHGQVLAGMIYPRIIYRQQFRFGKGDGQNDGFGGLAVDGDKIIGENMPGQIQK